MSSDLRPTYPTISLERHLVGTLQRYQLWVWAAAGIVSGLLMGLIVGALTGHALVLLLPPQASAR